MLISAVQLGLVLARRFVRGPSVLRRNQAFALIQSSLRTQTRVLMLFFFSFILGTISLSLTGTAFAAALSIAQTQEPVIAAPHWSPGSSWEYSDGYGLRVSATENGTTVFQRIDAPSQWFSMRGFLRQDAASATSKRQTIYRTEAPSAGDELKGSAPLVFQREYLSNNQLVVHATSWTVERRERITVPAGTFDCWVIVWRARSLKSNWTGFERWWYSPEAQHYVQSHAPDAATNHRNGRL